MHCPMLKYTIADPKKVEIIDALVAGHEIIKDDNVPLAIKDVIFALSHIIVDLAERLEEK